MTKQKINYAYDIETGNLVSTFSQLDNNISKSKKKNKKKKDKLLNIKNDIKKPDIKNILDCLSMSRLALVNFIYLIRENNYPEPIPEIEKKKIDEIDGIYLSSLVMIKYLVDNENMTETHLFDELDFINKLKLVCKSNYEPINNLFKNIEYYIKKYFGIEKKNNFFS